MLNTWRWTQIATGHVAGEKPIEARRDKAKRIRNDTETRLRVYLA